MRYKHFVHWYTIVLAVCGFVSLSQAAMPIIGNNFWYHMLPGTEAYRFWPSLQNAGVKLMRIGGTGVNDKPPTTAEYLARIDVIKQNNCEPLVQVSSYMMTAQQCADLVRTVNITNKKGVKYWCIGNEPWVHNNNTTPTEIMNYWKPRATAMKLVDPTIKLFGVEECYYLPAYYTSLIGGATDITGKDANGNYYLDYVSWHSYPFPGDDPYAVYTRDDVVKIGVPKMYNRCLQSYTDLTNANKKHGRTGSNALGFAITEVNIAHSCATNVDGVGAPSYLNGQFMATVYGFAMNFGAFAVANWSVFESGTRHRTDLGMFDAGPTYYPRSYYYHIWLIGKYFSGNPCPASTNQQYVQSFACTNGGKTTVMVLNMSLNGFDYRVGLNNSVTLNPALAVKVDAKIAKEYAGHINGQTTVVLVFDNTGKLIQDALYSSSDAQNHVAPHIRDYAVPITLPGRLQAEDYKAGGEGVGYHDLTAGNTGNAYRTDNVDIQACTDIGGGYNVGWTQAGEWLAFNVTVPTSGTYKMTARVSSGVAGTKTLKMQIDGADVSGSTINFTSAAGWGSWVDATSGEFTLTAGNHDLRLYLVTANQNLNYVDIFSVTETNKPPVVVITSPASNQNFPAAPSDVTVQATATDADGSVTKVEFFKGSTSMGTVTAPPYQYTFSGLAAGSYTLKATATDDKDASTSASVPITVGNATPVTINLNPAKDAYVKSGTNAAVNYGAATILEAKTQASDANVNRHIYLTFSLSSFTGTVDAATLQLYRTAGLANVAMTVYQCSNTSWTETGLTWNNKPAQGAAVATQTLAANGWINFNVGPYVAAQKAAGATAITFVCIGAEQGGTAQQVFSSKEGVNKPVLKIDYRSSAPKKGISGLVSVAKHFTLGINSCLHNEVSFTLPAAGDYHLTVYSLQGTRILEKVKSSGAMGINRVTIDAPAGTYLMNLSSQGEHVSQRVRIVR